MKAIIAMYPDANPVDDRYVFERAGRKTVLVLVPDASEAPRIAVELADQGATAIELCGSMGVIPQAQVQAAVKGRVPVGTTLFGFESLKSVVRFQESYAAGQLPLEAFLILQPGANPRLDRVVHEKPARLTIVAVPDAAAAARIAVEFAAQGVTEMELFGDFDAAGVSGVIAAAGPNVGVGFVAYGVHEAGGADAH